MRFDNARISQLKSADLFPLLDGLVSAGIGCELSIIRYAWRGASPELLVNWVDNSGVDWHCLHTNQSRRQLIASKTHSCSATIRWISLFGTVYLFLIRIERILCYKTKTRHFQTVTMLPPPPPRHDRFVSAKYASHDGSRMSYSAWRPGEPNGRDSGSLNRKNHTFCFCLFFVKKCVFLASAPKFFVFFIEEKKDKNN